MGALYDNSLGRFVVVSPPHFLFPSFFPTPQAVEGDLLRQHLGSIWDTGHDNSALTTKSVQLSRNSLIV